LSSGGPLLTKTLLFYSQAARGPELELSETDYDLRAFDKRTGEVLWERQLDLAPHGAPMTYMVDRRQYIVVAAGGAGHPAELIAFALP
jgi:quinoprotein glucose dehydrogenase